MFNNKERKLERMNSGLMDSVNATVYNMTIGIMLLYGFLVNAALVAFCGDIFINMNPIVFLIGYFVSAIVGMLIAVKSSNPVMSFVGYNLVVLPIGALLSICLPGFSASDIISAMVATGIVTAVMTGASMMFPNVFAGMGRSLFISLLLGLIVEVIAMLLGYGGDIFNWFFVIIFSCYIGYDWHKAQMYPKTIDNAIDSAIDIYLDIINLFIRLLEIFGKKRD